MRYSFLLLFAIFLSPILHSQDVTGKWSGIVTMEEWWEGITGPTHKRFEMTVQDNIVTGTMHGESKLIIDGKQLGEGSCYGTGTGELWRVAFNADGTYDLEINSHPFTCTGSSQLANEGQSVTSTDNHDDILIHNQLIPRNRNLLTGTIDTSGEAIGLGKFHKYISWTLINGPLDAVLVVTPLNYNTWMPKPGHDDIMKGDAMAVNLKVQSRNGGLPMIEAVKFEVRLTGTSKEPGTTINYPISQGLLRNDLPDLRLLPLPNIESPDEGQYLELDCSNGSTGSFFIGSYDGGGWTDLKVVAILKGGIRLDGHLLNPAGVTTIPVPKRKPGSHIADYWLQQHGNPGEMDDKEHVNGNSHDGDGLTAYEEYRGVWKQEQHERLLPDKKELGIMSKKEIWPIIDPGVNLFRSASGVEVIKFTDDEIDSDRKLNRNRQTSSFYEQYVLKIDTGQTSKNAAGENRPVNLDFMLPKESQEIIINTSFMYAFHPAQAAQAAHDHVPMPYTLNELINSTVAHVQHQIPTRLHCIIILYNSMYRLIQPIAVFLHCPFKGTHQFK